MSDLGGGRGDGEALGINVALVYFDALQPGGYPRDVRRLAGALSDQGVGVWLVTDPGPREDELGSAVVLNPRRFPEVQKEVNLVHLWGVFLPSQMRWARRLPRTLPLVISPVAHLMKEHIRSKWWKKLPYGLALRRFVGRWPHCAHVFSPEEMAGTIRYLRSPIHFEASLGVFPPPDGVAKDRARSGDYLLFLGRNDVYQKGLDLLLEGYALAVRQGLGLRLVIAGQPHASSQRLLERSISRLGLRDHVSLLGEVEEQEKWRLLSEARCLVFPSRWDGPPRPIREAISVGTPVIVTLGTNVGHLVAASGAGLLVDFDPASLAEGLLECRDEQRVARWREGATFLCEQLSWKEIAGQFVQGYQLTVTRLSGSP